MAMWVNLITWSCWASSAGKRLPDWVDSTVMKLSRPAALGLGSDCAVLEVDKVYS